MSELGPDGRPLPSLARTRVLGCILIPASLVMAYFWIYQPLAEAPRTGQLHFAVRGLLLPPALLYLGVALLLADLRDGQIRTMSPDGRARFTRKGWYFIGGLIAVLVVTLVSWYAYLRSMGFETF